ncbi:MAG: type II toxin-antitoxin system RelE/ParE family toxin [Chitinophagales bacterium]
MKREIILYKNYFINFYSSLSDAAQEKIEYSLKIIQEQEIVPDKFLRFITNSDGIYEVRARSGNNQYRVLCFFEEGNLKSGGNIVILGNGFIKKSNNRELKKAMKIAEQIKEKYFEEKDELKK